MTASATLAGRPTRRLMGATVAALLQAGALVACDEHDDASGPVEPDPQRVGAAMPPMNPDENDPRAAAASPTAPRDEVADPPTRQDFPDPTAVAANQAAADQVSDEDLSRFALAHQRVRAINQQFGPQISAAPNAQEAQKAQQKAAEMVTVVVKDAGLSMAEYSRIAKLAQVNPELRRKLAAAIAPAD